jgi:hypothetical protein
LENLTVTAQQEEPTGSEAGSLSAEAATGEASVAHSEPIAAPAPVAAQGSHPAASASAGDNRAAERPEPDAGKATPAKLEASGEDALRIASRVINMSSGNRAWETDRAGRKPQFGAGPVRPRKRRLVALVAAAAVAAVASAIGTLLTIPGLTGGFGHEAVSDRGLEESVARIDADVQALKASLESSSRLSLAQLSKTGEILAKLEKAQADPASKLGRLSEALELLREAPPQIATAPAAAARMATKESTGSITPQGSAASRVGRLPAVEGWLLRKISGGVALIEDRDGMYYEVHPGDPVPGLGRVDAIRRQDGRWVVVTSSGLIIGH